MNLAERLIWRLGRTHGHILAKHRNSKFLRVMEAACECFLNYYKNRSYDITRNGELRVMRCLNLPAGAWALDVGSHVGDYTAHLRLQNPHATIHAFEINPRNASIFAERFNQDPSIHLHCTGLSNKSGVTRVYDLSKDGQISSLYQHAGGSESAQPFTAGVQTGDEFLQAAGISEVHFLKVDTEGHDLAVLRGFLPQLTKSEIHILQFEYNETSIAAHVFLKDFFDLLEPLGYQLGKVYPKRVEFQHYDIHLEDHRASNYVAVGPSIFGREVQMKLREMS